MIITTKDDRQNGSEIQNIWSRQWLSMKKIEIIATVWYCEHTHKTEYDWKKTEAGKFEPNMYEGKRWWKESFCRLLFYVAV